MKEFTVHFNTASKGQMVLRVKAYSGEHARKKVLRRYPSALVGLVTK